MKREHYWEMSLRAHTRRNFISTTMPMLAGSMPAAPRFTRGDYNTRVLWFAEMAYIAITLFRLLMLRVWLTFIWLQALPGMGMTILISADTLARWREFTAQRATAIGPRRVCLLYYHRLPMISQRESMKMTRRRRGEHYYLLLYLLTDDAACRHAIINTLISWYGESHICQYQHYHFEADDLFIAATPSSRKAIDTLKFLYCREMAFITPAFGDYALPIGLWPAAR